MTKQEFLEKLAALLQDIPAEEREAALEFYRGYFDDAGESREAEVIRELESPEKVAEQIKNGLKTGLGTDSYENAGSPYDKNTSSRPVPENYGSYEKQPKKSSGWRTFGIVCLVLFIGIPIGIPVLVTVFALALSALVCVALLAVAVAMVMAAGFFAGIVFLVMGVARLALAPGVALMLCGSGFICLAAGILLLLLLMWVIGRGVPACWRGIKWLCRKIFYRRGGKGMKRFTKISLILSGGFLLLGIVLCLTAYTMGGRVGDLSVSYDSEKHSFVTGDQIKVTEGEEQHFQNIENLDLNMGVGELTVCYGSGKDFVLRSVGTGKFFCEQNGTTLKVNSKKAQYFFGINISSFGSSKDVAIVLEVPKGTDIRKLKAQVGVGTLTVNDLQVEELDGECGVGEFDFSGEIKKFGNLKCGIGSMYLNLVGSEKDYDYSLECGIGNISLGDHDFPRP